MNVQFQAVPVYTDNGQELRLFTFRGPTSTLIECRNARDILEFLEFPGYEALGPEYVLRGVVCEDDRLVFDLHDAFGRIVGRDMRIPAHMVRDKLSSYLP